jgi:hypothetical protein
LPVIRRCIDGARKGQAAKQVRAELFVNVRGYGFRAPRWARPRNDDWSIFAMIRKLASGKYRLYSRKKNPATGRRRNLGTFASRAAAEKHERAVQYFKRH